MMSFSKASFCDGKVPPMCITCTYPHGSITVKVIRQYCRALKDANWYGLLNWRSHCSMCRQRVGLATLKLLVYMSPLVLAHVQL